MKAGAKRVGEPSRKVGRQVSSIGCCPGGEARSASDVVLRRRSFVRRGGRRLRPDSRSTPRRSSALRLTPSATAVVSQARRGSRRAPPCRSCARRTKARRDISRQDNRVGEIVSVEDNPAARPAPNDPRSRLFFRDISEAAKVAEGDRRRCPSRKSGVTEQQRSRAALRRSPCSWRRLRPSECVDVQRVEERIQRSPSEISSMILRAASAGLACAVTGRPMTR